MGWNLHVVAEPYGGFRSSVVILNQQILHTTHEAASLVLVARLHWYVPLQVLY